ncbi:Dabb family protein [Ravibacter arvi]|uniref:Dabb family protein n=2 Tax=Ravibacter arvi TaxID=2051041 RepID=A0ABP8M794_9BACT
MKQVLFYFAVSIFLSSAFSCAEKQEETTGTIQSTDQKMLRHIVLFKFKDASTPEDVKAVEDAFRNLKNEIPEIKDFEWGKNNSPEGLNEGLTHAFFVSFTSEEDRAVYLPHPKHKAFIEVLKPHLEKAVVVDYWAEK